MALRNWLEEIIKFSRNHCIMKSIIALTLFVALTGVANASVSVSAVPDAGSTSVLMGLALAGIAVAKRFIC